MATVDSSSEGTVPTLHVMPGSPFSWRPWLALVEKGVEVKIEHAHSYDKSEAWLKISPEGMAPALVYKGRSVYESSVCAEYVDDEWPQEPALMPPAAADKAYVRMWTEFINKKIVTPFFAMVFKQTKAEQDEAAQKILEGLLKFMAAKKPGGPYFMGEQFTLADINMGSVSACFYILKYFRNFEVPKTEEYKQYLDWEAVVLGRDSWKAILPNEKVNIEKWREACEGRHIPQMSKDV